MVNGLLLLTLLAGAQDAPAAAQPPSLTLDFLVSDRDGKVPADLTPAEVELKIGGRQRPLLSLDRIDSGPRDILLLVEEATLYRLEPAVKDGVKQLIASLQPNDRVRYVSTRRSRATLRPGAEEALAAVDSMVTGPGELYTCLADMVTNIANFAQRLPPGRASTLVIIGRGHPEGAASGSEGDAAPCTPRREAMREAGDIVAARQINLMLFTASETSRSWGFETLAGNTGGGSLLLSFANTDALARAIATTRTFYRARFAADPAAPDRPQRVELRVKRSRLKVTTSASLVIKPSRIPSSGK